MDNQGFSQSRRAILRQTVGLGTLAIGGLSPRILALDAGPTTTTAPREYVEVETNEGRLRGLREKDLCVFRGVRYAGAPIGHARFLAAPPLAKWKGVRRRERSRDGAAGHRP